MRLFRHHIRQAMGQQRQGRRLLVSKYSYKQFGVKVFQKSDLQMFYMKEMYSTNVLHLKDTHFNVNGWIKTG